MNISIGIVGLPNVGKSTLFKALTKNEVNIANYPFCTINPNVGVVSVEDERLKKLATMNGSPKAIPAVVEFYDIAGLVKDAHKGAGLGNQFLSHIRDVAAIIHVVRIFEDQNIIHVESEINPARDIDIINSELAFKDLETIDKHVKKVQKEARAGGKGAAKELEVLNQAKNLLENNNLLTNFYDDPLIKHLGLLATKKQIYLLNGGEKDLAQGLIEKIKNLNAEYITADLATVDEIPDLITKAYKILNLITFFTFNEKEARAWAIKNEAKIVEAAGAIHSDFEKKFIKAEVTNFEKLLDAGSWTKAKNLGLIRVEGKDYIVQDGDVVLVRHG